MPDKKPYGQNDNSYISAGQEAGLKKLSKDFYQFMDTLPEAQKIREMHGESLENSAEKLGLFLCGWLGGPKKFSEKYGPINIPRFHKPLKVGSPEKEAWLLCMEKAIEQQDYSVDFKKYLLTQLRVPAERIQAVAEQ